MPLLGQASGGWTESSSQLRILNLGVRNSIGVITDDSLTQTNPTAVTTVGTVSTRVDTTALGVLSGSVAFCRPDGGSNFIGGPGSAAVQAVLVTTATPAWAIGYRALGLFINSATGNDYENTPAVASGVCPYVCAMGTHASALYETNLIAQVQAVQAIVGAAITYRVGNLLISSRNGFIMPTEVIGLDGVRYNADIATVSAESFVQNAASSATRLGVVKMPPDAVQTEVVFDLRV